MLLEETVNEEYCTYITSKYSNFEAILQNMADQFNHIDCGDSILMRCNGKFIEETKLCSINLAVPIKIIENFPKIL